MDTFDLLPVTAGGDLAETSAPELVAAIFRARASGTLSIETPDGEVRQFFRMGDMCGSASFAGFRTLAQVLLANEWASALEIDSTLADAQGSGRRHGEVLVESGLLTAEQLTTALLAQHRYNLSMLLQLSQGRYELRGWEPPPPWSRELSIEPVSAVAEELAREERAGRRERVLAWLEGAPVRLTVEWPDIAQRVPLEPASRRAAQLLTLPRRVAEFITLSRLPQAQAEALLASLLLVGAAEPQPLGKSAPPPHGLETLTPPPPVAAPSPSLLGPRLTSGPRSGPSLLRVRKTTPPPLAPASAPPPPTFSAPPPSFVSQSSVRPISIPPMPVNSLLQPTAGLRSSYGAITPPDEDFDASELIDAHGDEPLVDPLVLEAPSEQLDAAAVSGPSLALDEAPVVAPSLLDDDEAFKRIDALPIEPPREPPAAPVQKGADEAELRRVKARMLARGLRNLAGGAPAPAPDETPAHEVVSHDAPLELARHTPLETPALTTEDRIFAAEVRRKAALVAGQDAFQRLGLGQNATSEQIRSAYIEGAKKFHPDRASTAGLASLQGELKNIFNAIKEAYDEVGSASARGQYLDALKAGTSGPVGQKTQSRKDEAALALKMGEVFLKKRDFAQALVKLRRAVELDPNGDALAALAWGLMCDPSTSPAAKEEVASLVNKALRATGISARTYYVAGVLWRTKDPDSAADAFRKALELEPNHPDASLELRLLEMRQGKKQAPGVLSGLLFGRNKR